MGSGAGTGMNRRCSWRWTGLQARRAVAGRHLMTASKDYFTQQIADTVSKALGLNVTVELVDGNEIKVLARIDGQPAESPFYKALLEQFE